MVKYRLDISSEDLELMVIGINCLEPDYRLAWAMSKVAGFQFERCADFVSEGDGRKFPMYQFEDVDLMRVYHLIANRFNNQIAVTPLEQIDYLLVVTGAITGISDELIEKIHGVDFVMLATEIDINLIKSNESLLSFL
ncbi:MAG: IPExxxVDY family protein [Candidatus Competibacteraceae bacterium]|nr:IPExxxVDY family protein [Candidatus Competibacteraceae bacterium]